jgi:hypothetical protein
MKKLNNFFESIIKVPRKRVGKRQIYKTLINEEAMVFAKHLRDEKQKWIPRIVNVRARLLLFRGRDLHSLSGAHPFLRLPRSFRSEYLRVYCTPDILLSVPLEEALYNCCVHWYHHQMGSIFRRKFVGYKICMWEIASTCPLVISWPSFLSMLKAFPSRSKEGWNISCI